MKRPLLVFIGLAAASTAACDPPPEPPKAPWQSVAAVPPERPICGWEEVTTGERPLVVTADGTPAVSPGQGVALIAPLAATPYRAVRAALTPADTSLVRVKLLVDERWLLSTTYPQKLRQLPKPPPAERATRIVGDRQITRSVKRPAERFAALRVAADKIHLFVENDAPRGRELAPSTLRETLRALEPKAEVFALTATDDTPWAVVLETALAAACYDRAPGDEPHEVILD